MKKTILSIMFCCYCIMAPGQELVRTIEKIICGKRASVGIAIIHGDEVFTVANDGRYPIMSVFKLHVAVTALKKMEMENIPLDAQVYIEKDQIKSDTYSPLRDKYPDKRICVSYATLLEYTLAQSDNNTCDWLIWFVGGIDRVDDCIRSLGIEDFELTQTEDDMHMDIEKCYDNWSTPLAVAQLLKKIDEDHILSDEHTVFLRNVMLDCVSGKNKLVAGLPPGVGIGHKTGHSDRTADGLQICDADAGVIYLSDSERCYIVVLVKDSRESDSDNAAIMSDICNVAYNYFKK